MANSKYTLYKYVKVAGTWRYCKAAYHEDSKIEPDIVFVNVKQALLEKHPAARLVKWGASTRIPRNRLRVGDRRRARRGEHRGMLPISCGSRCQQEDSRQQRKQHTRR
jgi:hypothetical protein